MLRLAAAVAACMGFIGLAQAQNVQQAEGVWCSSQAYARAFVTQWDGTNSEEALAAVNATSSDIVACRPAVVGIYEVEEYDKVETKAGLWLLVKVMVVAVQTPDGWSQVSPFEAYTARRVTPLPGDGA